MGKTIKKNGQYLRKNILGQLIICEQTSVSNGLRLRIGQYWKSEMSARRKEIAKIVDDCLNQLLGQCTQINLTAILLNQWEIAVKKSNIQLSPQKVEISLKKMGIQVMRITMCADDWMCDRNWKELNLAH